MNQNSLNILWTVSIVFILSAFLNGFLVFQNTMLHKDLDTLKERTGRYPQFQAVLQNLTRDLVEYAGSQPEIIPTLNKYGIQVQAPANLKIENKKAPAKSASSKASSKK